MGKIKQIKANFRIPKDEWIIFKELLRRYHKIRDEETGIEMPVTPSWMLREMISDFIYESEEKGHFVTRLIQEIEKYNPTAPILQSLWNYVEENDENEEK